MRFALCSFYDGDNNVNGSCSIGLVVAKATQLYAAEYRPSSIRP